MAETFKFELVSPERVVLEADAEQVVVPGSEGDFAILPQHAPIVSTLRPGILNIDLPDGSKRVYVDGGFAQMDNETLTILVERSLVVDEVDADTIADEVAAAEKALSGATSDEAVKAANDALSALKTLR